MSDVYRNPYERYEVQKSRSDRLETVMKFAVPAIVLGLFGILGSYVHGCATRPELEPSVMCKSTINVVDSLTYENTRSTTRRFECFRGAELELVKDPMNPMIVYAVCNCKTSKDPGSTRLSVVSSAVTMPSAPASAQEEEIFEDK